MRPRLAARLALVACLLGCSPAAPAFAQSHERPAATVSDDTRRSSTPPAQPHAPPAAEPRAEPPGQPREARSGAAPDSTRRDSTSLAKQPAFRAEGVLVLPGETLLLWAADGRVQVGSPEKGWAPVLRMPMTYVTSAITDDAGALLAGSQFPRGEREHAVAVAVDAQGAIRTRWDGGEGIFNAVTREQGRRWAVALDRLVELLPEGGLRPEGPVPSLSRLVVGAEGQQVLCVPANLSLAHAAPAACGPRGGDAWRVEGRWRAHPLACGGWLVTKEGAEVVVRGLANGEVVARRTVPGEALACAGRDEVWVADTRVRALALPTLVPRWEAPCGRGTVAALAASENGGACVDAKGTVVRLGSSPPKKQ